METLLTQKGPLLNEDGDLAEAGYALSLIKDYDRSKIKAKPLRIKEWDYYYVGNSHYGVALTIDDNSYMGMASISLLDFEAKEDVTKSPMKWFTKGSIKLPSTSEKGDVIYEDEKQGFSMQFLNSGEGKRHLVCYMEKMGKKGEAFHCDITLEERNQGSLVIATPFHKKHHFYYNQKINDLEAHGYAKLGDRYFDFNEDSYGVLDWGRGVWTYKNTWYWSSCNASFDGHLIGWNLGYGFGDTSKASENIFYYDGKPYKLGRVKFDIPLGSHGEDFLKEWGFRFESDSFDLRFKPVYDRHADINAGILRSNQHQVFGLFTGSILLDGRPVSFKAIPGFAEKVFNKW